MSDTGRGNENTSEKRQGRTRHIPVPYWRWAGLAFVTIAAIGIVVYAFKPLNHAVLRQTFGLGSNSVDQGAIEKSFAGLAGYSIIKERFPLNYNQITVVARDVMQRGGKIAAARRQVQPIVRRIYRNVIPTTSDRALIEFWRLSAIQHQALFLADPEQCANHLKGVETDFINDVLFRTHDRELMAVEVAIKDSGNYDGPAPGLSIIRIDFLKMAAESVETGFQGQNHFLKSFAGSLSSELYCKSFIYLSRRLSEGTGATYRQMRRYFARAMIGKK